MLDDIREWISDNLRYILLGLAALLIILMIIFAVRLITGSRGKNEKDNPVNAGNDTDPKQEEVVAVEEEPQTDGVVLSEEEPAASSLVKDDAAVLTLVRDYYTARAGKDITALSRIVTPWDSAAQDDVLNNELIESYNDISTWSKEGLEEGSYVVYTSFKAKIPEFETLVPSLRMQYLLTEDGSLKIFADYHSDPQIAEYVTKVTNEADVQQLLQQVNDEYASALNSDPDLAAYLSSLTADAQAAEEADEDTTAAAGAGEERTALYGLNIREQTSTESNILGSVPANAQVKVLQDVEDGWSRISYDPGGGEIIGYVRTEYLS